MYHQGNVAASGFTKEHMESFVHLDTYALGALGNQHGLTPEAPRDPAKEQEGISSYSLFYRLGVGRYIFFFRGWTPRQMMAGDVEIVGWSVS